MRRIILAPLTTVVLLSATHLVFAECQTLAQAKAANPRSRLLYHRVAGAQCWFAAPSYVGQPVTQKRTQRPARLSKVGQSDESPAAQAPPDARDNVEHESVAPVPDRPENAQPARQFAETFDTVESNTNSVQAPERRILGRSDGDVEVLETTQPPPQHAAPTRAPARYPMPVAWLLLTVSIGTVMIVILKSYRERLKARAAHDIRSQPRVRILRTRDRPRLATPLITHVAPRILDAEVSFSQPDSAARAPFRMT
jgi:hypothetical protein